MKTWQKSGIILGAASVAASIAAAAPSYTTVLPEGIGGDRAASVTPRDFVDGTVNAEVWAFSNSFNALIAGDDVTSPGNTLLPNTDPGSGILRDVNVSVSVTDLGATERAVTVRWESATPGTPFIDAGTQLGSETITFIAFSFGNDVFGSFPTALNPFEDPEFGGVIETTGGVFNALGEEVIQFEEQAGTSGIFAGD